MPKPVDKKDGCKLKETVTFRTAIIPNQVYLVSNTWVANSLIYYFLSSVSDPSSFFTDPDPEDPDGGQYGSGSKPDPGL